jgi:hypothetical protein
MARRPCIYSHVMLGIGVDSHINVVINSPVS